MFSDIMKSAMDNMLAAKKMVIKTKNTVSIYVGSSKKIALNNKNNNSTYTTELLGGFNEVRPVEHFS